MVVDILFCRGDSFEEDLRWKPKLGVFGGLVELNDEVDDVGVTLFNPNLYGGICPASSFFATAQKRLALDC